MPDKKNSVLTQLLYVFQKKRPPCDDIVTAADKVIEEYIFCKNKLIRAKCNNDKRESITLSALLISVAAAIVLLYLIISP